MMDNRVVNNRSPSLNSEETFLSRRQRATLSQLRSGHCKLLNSYIKRLKQIDCSSCSDCVMDPQDVPHLFICTAHPIDLSRVNLCDKPIKTIRKLSFLHPGNMDRRGWLKMTFNDNQRKPGCNLLNQWLSSPSGTALVVNSHHVLYKHFH